MGRRKEYEGAKLGAAAERLLAAVQNWSCGGDDGRGDNVGDGDGVRSTGDATVEVAGPGPAQARGASRSADVELDELARQVVVAEAAVASCIAPVVVAAVAVAVAAAV